MSTGGGGRGETDSTGDCKTVSGNKLTLHNLTSVTPNGIFPTYSRRACLLIVLPANGTVVLRVMAAGATGTGGCATCPVAKKIMKNT